MSEMGFGFDEIAVRISAKCTFCFVAFPSREKLPFSSPCKLNAHSLSASSRLRHSYPLTRRHSCRFSGLHSVSKRLYAACGASAHTMCCSTLDGTSDRHPKLSKAELYMKSRILYGGRANQLHEEEKIVGLRCSLRAETWPDISTSHLRVGEMVFRPRPVLFHVTFHLQGVNHSSLGALRMLIAILCVQFSIGHRFKFCVR